MACIGCKCHKTNLNYPRGKKIAHVTEKAKAVSPGAQTDGQESDSCSASFPVSGRLLPPPAGR